MSDHLELARQEAQGYAAQGGLYRPLAASAVDPDESPAFATGLPGVDKGLGGGYRSGLHLLVGYSHNAKTQVLYRMIWENRDKLVVLFSPDESTEMVINKMLSLATGEHVDEIFWWPASRKAGLIQEHFPHLVVDDDFLNGSEMFQLIAEAKQIHQQEVAAIGYDFLENFGSNRGGDQIGAIKSKIQRFKQFSKDPAMRFPWIVLHQLSRSGSTGQPIRMTDLNYGGEQQAITITGCRRQFFDPHLATSKRRWEETRPTVHVSIVKNKQRPYLNIEGFQYAIELNSGMVREMRPEEKIMTGLGDLPR